MLPFGASINSGQGTNAINANWGATGGNLSVAAVNACGASTNRTIVVSVFSCIQDSESASEAEVGVEENSDVSFMNVYPNPNNGNFIIETDMTGVFTIYNELGAVVKTFEIQQTTNMLFAVEDLSPGMYFISAVNDHRNQVERIIVTGQ